MRKKDIVDALEAASGCRFIKRRDIAVALGYKDAKSIDKYLRGLNKIAEGRYLVDDVAQAIIEEVEAR